MHRLLPISTSACLLFACDTLFAGTPSHPNPCRPPPPHSGRRYGRGGGQGQGHERRGRVSQHGDLNSQLQLEELLLHLRRLPRDAPLHPSITQVC